MAKLVEVTALRSHRSGYAAGGRVSKDGTYSVPADRVASLVRMGLVSDPGASRSGSKGKGKVRPQPLPQAGGEQDAPDDEDHGQV